MKTFIKPFLINTVYYFSLKDGNDFLYTVLNHPSWFYLLLFFFLQSMIIQRITSVKTIFFFSSIVFSITQAIFAEI